MNSLAAFGFLVPVLALGVGYWIGTQAPDEIRAGKRTILGLTLMLALLVIIDLSIGSGTYAPGSITSIQLLSVFAIFLGTLFYARKTGILATPKKVAGSNKTRKAR